MSEIENNKQIHYVYPSNMQTAYEDDEINLVDLWIVLSTYKNYFYKVFFILIVLGVLFSIFVYKEKFELTTTIQIGTYAVESGELPIESPESLLSKVTNSIEPLYTSVWKNKEGYLNEVKTEISNPKESNVLVIKNKMVSDDVELFKDYQLKLSDAVISDHQKIIKSLQAKLISQLAIEELKLKELENPLFLEIKLKEIEINLDAEKIKLKKLQDEEFFGIKKNQFKNKIIAAKNVLGISIGKSNVINKKLQNLNETKSILKKNIDELSSLIAVAHKNKKKSLANATEINAMSLLLIDNEIQQNQNRLLTLEERYYVGIENERSALQDELESNKINQSDQKNKISLLEEKYKEMILDNTLQIAQQKLAVDKIILRIEKVKLDTRSDIDKKKQSINELQITLDNYNQTRIISKPVLSQRPVGLSQKLLIVIMIVLSGFVAFILIMIKLFTDRVKERQSEIVNE